MFYILISIVYVLAFSIANIFGLEKTFSMPITISYNNDVPKKDRFILNDEEIFFLNDKILSWKSEARKWSDESPDPICLLIKNIPFVDVLLGDSEILRYKNIVEQTYSFSAYEVYTRALCLTHEHCAGRLVSEKIFRQKLLFLEMFLYGNHNIVKSPFADTIGMRHRFNDLSTDSTVERDFITDFLLRHRNCGIDKAKILATIFLLYLPS